MGNYRLILISLCCSILFACNSSDSKKENTKIQEPKEEVVKVDVPDFSADSAFFYIEKQVAFGPRIPNTKTHEACGDWLIAKMETWSDRVIVQKADLKAFDGNILKARNIIASFNPQAQKRIMLSAHWDTRPFADQDNDTDLQKKPIDGANDGASGVAVLMEVARQLSLQKIDMGLDIIFWDAEDYGQPDNDTENPRMMDSYCLGSQYWARNKHKGNYTAKYGILLDMVGAENATFRLEDHSMQYAPTVNKKIWNKAIELGYGKHFILQNTRPIIDDHYYITLIARIPTIDIIDLDPGRQVQFGDFWHTHDDNMDIISKSPLKAVGQTLLEVLYLEDKGAF